MNRTNDKNEGEGEGEDEDKYDWVLVYVVFACLPDTAVSAGWYGSRVCPQRERFWTSESTDFEKKLENRGCSGLSSSSLLVAAQEQAKLY